ncbi:MAG: hypothetical protein M3081_15050, partial [Gemmatimonadota bacterium]|nr:hypothetical protein [Gemmatimonadota bacterium]
MRSTIFALLMALPAALSAQNSKLTAADSALVGRILLAEDRRDSTEVALVEGSRHADARVRTLARRARGRIGDPRFTERDSLPPLRAPKVWPETAWRLRFRALTVHHDDCGALRAALADSAWAVRLHAADLIPTSCASDDAMMSTLRKWVDSLSADASSRARGRVSWHAGAHALVSLARLRPDDARSRLGKLASHRQ